MTHSSSSGIRSERLERWREATGKLWKESVGPRTNEELRLREIQLEAEAEPKSGQGTRRGLVALELSSLSFPPTPPPHDTLRIMSWQTYVDSNLLGTGKVTKAAILGQAGGVWATSSGYTLSTEEQTNIVQAFKDPSQAQANGIRAAGAKFFTLTANDRSLYGKKQADGIIIVKTKQAVLVAEYANPTLPGEATKIVEDLADYLIGVGY